MEKYKVSYHLSKDLIVDRILEAESKEEALRDAKSEEVVRFENERGALLEFNMKDVQLIAVRQIPKARAVQRPF